MTPNQNLFYASVAALILSLAIAGVQADPSRLLQYTTFDTRTETVEDLCANYASRDDLVDQQA